MFNHHFHCRAQLVGRLTPLQQNSRQAVVTVFFPSPPGMLAFVLVALRDQHLNCSSIQIEFCQLAFSHHVLRCFTLLADHVFPYDCMAPLSEVGAAQTN